MNSFVLLPLQECMVQHGAGNNNQWRRNVTILVVNYGIIQSISVLTAVLWPRIKCQVDKLRGCFRKTVQCALTNR
jgi:hypothetical protein